MTEYLIPTGEGESELVEKRSRFLGHVWRAASEEEARRRIEETRKTHYDARHNCWCYLLKDGPVRYSDDGEPQGTAGQPMLNVFQREGVTDAVCVVTRYFVFPPIYFYNISYFMTFFHNLQQYYFNKIIFFIIILVINYYFYRKKLQLALVHYLRLFSN